jgi:hypothetical protein
MNPGSIGAIAGVIAVPILFALLRTLCPFTPPLRAREYSWEKLEKQYRKWEVFSIVPLFGFTAALATVWYTIIRFFVEMSITDTGKYHHLLLPDGAFWALPALFLGMVSSVLPTTLLYKLLLRDRYEEYILCGNLRVGFDAWRVFRGLALVISLGCAALIVLGLDWYVRFTEEEIVINRLLRFDELRYPYSRVQRIRAASHFKAPVGTVREVTYFAIDFEDGERWTTRDGPQDLSRHVGEKIIQFVAERSGKGIEKVRLIDD